MRSPSPSVPGSPIPLAMMVLTEPARFTDSVISRSPPRLASSPFAPRDKVNRPGSSLIRSTTPGAASPAGQPLKGALVFAAVTASRSEHSPSSAIVSAVVVTLIRAPLRRPGESHRCSRTSKSEREWPRGTALVPPDHDSSSIGRIRAATFNQWVFYGFLLYRQGRNDLFDKERSFFEFHNVDYVDSHLHPRRAKQQGQNGAWSLALG